jgi:hypothetical protein
VRAEVHPGIGAWVLRRALLRRRFGRSAWTLPVLFLAVFVPLAGANLMFRSIGEDLGTVGIFIMAGTGWFGPAIFALISNEPGTDPAATARATLDQRPSQAMRVAVDGLQGLTDPKLRAALTVSRPPDPAAPRRYRRVRARLNGRSAAPSPAPRVNQQPTRPQRTVR